MAGSIVGEPRLSIVTVVYNNDKHIERTLLSVINQTYTNIEYIVIDGNSSDGTTSIIKKYEGKISQWISESDNGIYDAMNKSIKMCTGDYLMFLNSGDELYEPFTIAKIFANYKDADIYYGETEIYSEDWISMGGRRLKAPISLNWKSLKKGMLVCHQSFIVKRKIAPLYDLKYKLTADFDWMLKCLKKSNKVENTNIYISKFMTGGKSRQNTFKSLKERFEIMVRNYGITDVLFCHLIISIKFFAYVVVNRKIN